MTAAVICSLAAPSSALADKSVSQTQSAETVKEGHDVTYTVTVTNTGPAVENAVNVFLATTAAGRYEKIADNPYRSVVPTQGSCRIQSFEESFGAHRAECTLGPLDPGASAQIVAISTVNNSVNHVAQLVNCFGESASCGLAYGSPNSAEVTTLVDAPPEIEGSKKIKLRGLPSGCAERDFRLTVTAKGAKKITGSYSGPRTVEGGNPFEDFRQVKLDTGKGSKLTDKIPAGKLDPGYYEIKLVAKYDGKPKQKATVFLQRCGVPP